MDTLLLGLACWLLTTIVVESEITRSLREWVHGREEIAAHTIDLYEPGERGAWRFVVESWVAHHVRYLLGCHLCTGVWVGLILALVQPSSPLGNTILDGLAYKAIAHLVLVAVNATNTITNSTTD